MEHIIVKSVYEHESRGIALNLYYRIKKGWNRLDTCSKRLVSPIEGQFMPIISKLKNDRLILEKDRTDQKCLY